MKISPPQLVLAICLATLSGCIEGKKLDADGGADQRVDSKATTPDQSAKDSTLDWSPPDLTIPEDVAPPPPDTLVLHDLSPPNTCVDSAVRILTSDMVLCTTFDEPKTQCNAEELCNVQNGWHLCTASEYLARGGDTGVLQVNEVAWLASCVWEPTSESATTPTDDVCTSCASFSNEPGVTYGWSCTGLTSESTPVGPLGVVTSTSCLKLGPDETVAVPGFWTATVNDIGYDSAVCCK